MLPNQVHSNAQQAKMLRHRGLQQKESLKGKQREDRKTSLKPASYKARGGGIYRFRNKASGPTEAWGARRKVIGKRCGNRGSALGYRPLHILRVEFSALCVKRSPSGHRACPVGGSVLLSGLNQPSSN